MRQVALLKNLKYSRVSKIIAIILQHLAISVLAISVVVVVTCYDEKLITNGAIGELGYINSKPYKKDVEENVADLLYYLQLKCNFETNGHYNARKVVDLKDYIEQEKITGEVVSGTGYVLEDLLNWGKEGVSYDSYIYYVSGGRVKIETTDDYEGFSLELEARPGVERYGKINLIHENYQDAQGKSLSDREWSNVEELLRISRYLEQTIKSIPQDLQKYREKLTTYKVGNTNFSYYILNKATGVSFSNMPDSVSEDNALEKIKALGTYIFVESTPTSYVFDSSPGGIQNTLSSYLENMNYLDGNHYKVYVGVDEALEIPDSLYEGKREYENMQPWFFVCLILGFVGILVYFSTFIFLTIVTGYQEDRQLMLNGFDKIKTEIGATMVILLMAGFFFLAQNALEASEGLLKLAVLAVAAPLINLAFMAGFLSMIRRGRAGTLWKNSIVCALGKVVRQLYLERKITARVFIAFGAVSAVTVALCAWAFRDGSAFALFLLLMDVCFVGNILMKDAIQRNKIMEGIRKMTEEDLGHKIALSSFKGDNLIFAMAINNMAEGMRNAVNASIKNERMKTDLITNVSHDLKTPLTSIISYVDLIKRENIDNERVRGYVEILEEKSQRLKHLTEDLVESSRISSGNIVLQMERINFVELLNQTASEFVEKFEARGLKLITDIPNRRVVIEADGRRIWRILENLFHNVEKYAMENSRVYGDLVLEGNMAWFSLKNISAEALNFNAEELTERFIRGDVSRSTEGSGLGLSIAKNLTELQKGVFEIYLDGDLFKVTIGFALIRDAEKFA